jgi:hypothetical protein
MAKGVSAGVSPPPTWDEISSKFGMRLVEDIQTVLAAKLKPGEIVAESLGIRHFLGWLSDDTRSPAKNLVHIFSRGSADGVSDLQSVQLIVQAMERWFSEAPHRKGMTPLTVTGYGRRASHAIELLGEMPERHYPPFQRRLVSIPKLPGKIETLGSLGWPEIESLIGAAREKRALSMVREAALLEFERTELVFRFGLEVLSGQEGGRDPEARALVREFLEAERLSWQKTGRSQFHPENSLHPDVARIKKKLGDRSIWRDAGLNIDGTGRLKSHEFPTLALACLGATRQSTAMVVTVFACDTGWNRQPILDLPRQPFVFETKDQCGIATAAFAESFKTRAGHSVMAYLDRDNLVSGLAEERVRAEWAGTVNAFNSNGEENGHAVITRDSPMLDLLDRYRAMTEAIRSFDLHHEHTERYFVYLTPNVGLHRKEGLTISECADGDVLGRKGVTFQAIRKSFLSLKLREVGSVEALRPIAGHSRSSILMAHYVNSAEINAELDDSIRFFQNACQALILNDHHAVEISLDPQDVEWFRRLADASGISAAVGMVDTWQSGNLRTLRFDPTAANLRDLFLTHLALRKARWQVPAGRWTVQGLPLLAIVKAIGRTLCAKGLRSSYKTIARATYQEFTLGLIALPPVLQD